MKRPSDDGTLGESREDTTGKRKRSSDDQVIELVPQKPYELFFVTSNEGKLKHLQDALAPLLSSGMVSLRTVGDLDIPEPQSDCVESIARAKAVAAQRAMGGQPVLVQDAGLVIEALRGFPGPYTKYILQTIGVQGLLKLLEGRRGHAQRRAGFDTCVVFCDEVGEVHVFRELDQYFGTLLETASEATGNNQGVGWKCPELWRLFVPLDFDRAIPLSDFSDEELRRYRQSSGRPFSQFAQWLAKRLDFERRI